MDALLYTLLTQADRQKKAGAGWLSALVLVLLLAGCTAARPSFLALRFHLALVTCKRCVTFFLQANQLQGPLPPTLGDLHRLQDLHLCENQLQGPLPLTLAQLADLQHVKLQRNDASLCLPASMLTWAHSRAIYEAPPGGLCP